MQIGKTIRKYRKEIGITQEEMAKRLGVTTPAVNKWENENSYPDITLLAPIARLLGISLDTLLSFQEELTPEEISAIVSKADQKCKTQNFADVFKWAKSVIETYPNCLRLVWQLATILDAQCLLQEISNTEDYDSFVLDCYNRVLKSEEESLRIQAAESLFGYYLRKEQYELAENCLQYFSAENPNRKLKLASIYSRTNRIEEAYKVCEQLLFSEYQIINLAFHNLYLLSMKNQDFEKAHILVDKQETLARLFEMGKYHEVSYRLDLATAEKDTETILDTMQAMLDSVTDMTGFSSSALYAHMDFRETSSEFLTDMKQELLKCFRDKETYGFLENNQRWKKITQQS